MHIAINMHSLVQEGVTGRVTTDETSHHEWSRKSKAKLETKSKRKCRESAWVSNVGLHEQQQKGRFFCQIAGLGL